MGFFWSKPVDAAADVSDLSGRVALVTGANRGLGYGIALLFARRGAKVYVACRSLSKAEQAITEMEASDPAVKGRLQPLEVDLGSVRKSRKAGENVLAQEGAEGRLDMLVCNAAQTGGAYAETEEGISTAIASNHLGHYALTRALLPLLERTALLPGADMRIVNVSSDAEAYAPKPVQFKSVQDFRQDAGQKEGGLMVQMARYGQSKLCNILLAKELQRRWAAAQPPIPGIALSLHPGGVATDGAKNFLGTWYHFIPMPFVAPEQAAGLVLFAAASPTVRRGKEYEGGYLRPGPKLAEPSKEAMDEELARDLWELSERVCEEIEQRGRRTSH